MRRGGTGRRNTLKTSRLVPPILTTAQMEDSWSVFVGTGSDCWDLKLWDGGQYQKSSSTPNHPMTLTCLPRR